MKFAGIDPGTSSYEIFILKDEKPLKKIEIPTKEVRNDPGIFKEILLEIHADLIAGLSGYGMPVKRFSELDEKDVFLLTLNTDPKTTMGMRMLVEIAKELDLNLYTIPGVIHLPTVPEYRKINRIDMGTADKLCSAVLGIYQLSKESDSESFVLTESGFGFNAFIAVRNGKIVDGLGGSSSFPAFSSLGAIDGELAYLLKPFPKEMLFSGGVRSYLRDRGKRIESIKDMPQEALQWFAEYLMKGVRAADVSCKAEKILFSGKNFSYDELTRIFREMAENFGYECEELKGFGIAKQSAEGAAIIANGIGGGGFREIIEKAEISNAKGSVLDYITSDVWRYLRIF